MARLLDLPAEILDIIIELVLLREQRLPTTIDEARQSRLPISQSHQPGAYGPRNVVFGNTATVSNAAPLLRINKQLCTQTRQGIARLFPEGAKYKLDVMLVHETQLWPTWLHVPYLAEHIQSIEVSFRVFGMNRELRSAFRNRNGGALVPIIWTFYFLLDHLLKWGPYPSTSNQSLEAQQRHHITVNILDLRFLAGDPAYTPPNDGPQLYAVWTRLQRNRFSHLVPNENNQLAIHPNWLANRIQEQIHLLLDMSYHYSPYGTQLLERIGQFRISRLPSTTAEPPEVNIFVYEILGNFYLAPDNDHPENFTTLYTWRTMKDIVMGDCRVLTFWNWKWKTLKERHKRGLINPSDVVWPDLKTWLRWRQIAGEAVGCRSGQWRCMCLETGLEDWLKSQVTG